jgi:nicotinate phosphoribosyltransferase
MASLHRLYADSLALLTDLYQLTMAEGYFRCGRAEDEAVFHLSFRTHPFDGQFALACGLAEATEFLAGLRFREDDLAYLAGLKAVDGSPLFGEDFVDCLRAFEFTCDVDAVPEGTLVFAHEPMARVRGPLLACQLLETPLLTLLNFPTLVATKAARVCHAARGEPVLEFGLRRAQGIDGGVTASRSAFVGGCAATSNMLAGKLYGIPVKGTHAHSWVMSFDDELESFRAYARAMPNNCVFLVDTYDTLQGVRNAAEVAKSLRAGGHRLLAVRLDSGDMAELSKQARRILDDAGLADCEILASGDLDEHKIAKLKRAGATIAVWGVGTRLATCYDEPALGGVYKLSAVRRRGEAWRYKVKLSERLEKVSDPGILQVRRFSRAGKFAADVIYDEPTGIESCPGYVDPNDRSIYRIPAGARGEDLLVAVFRGGRQVYEPPPVHEAQRRARDQLASLDEALRQTEGDARYPVGYEERLHRLKHELIAETARQAGVSLESNE